MAPISVPLSGATLARGMRTEMANSYENAYQGLQTRLGRWMDLGVASSTFEELFGYHESAPYPEFRPWGQEVPMGTFSSRSYTGVHRSYDMSVKWFKHQRIFDQLGGLDARAREAGRNFATLPERILYQVLTGTADPRLLPVIPLAPDGAALYSATDGAGADRFGVTGGNVLTGSGVATAEAIRSDLFDALERLASFLDTQGQPLNDPGLVTQGATLTYNLANEKVVREAVMQAITLDAGGTGAGVSNIVLSGLNINLEPTVRITDDDMFLTLDQAPIKPITEAVAQPLEEVVQVEDNSDESRLKKIEGVFFSTIRLYVVNLPRQTVKIDN